ncbi:MAG: VCBS repeat-containing protein, partial [Bacteroidia bacterium]|nr:VCBS repeat-containing protein [Bacteroidia bacterium]
IQTAPTIVDLDNNGQLDFVVGTWNFNHLDSIYAFRGDNHTRMWSYPVHDYMYHGTAVADFDNDGKRELVIGSYNDTLYCINGENGTTKWKYAGSGGYIGAPASIADINGDGNCEVVFFSAYVVTALSSSGVHLWHYNIPGYEQSFRGAALADINNDAYLDVIFGTDGGKVIALNGNNGTVIWTKDLAAHYGNPDFGFDHAPLVADFDNDDSLEVFIVGGYASYPNFQNDFGRAYMITAGKGVGPDWLMFQHDLHRQSSLCVDSTNSLNEITESISVSVFPNPATNELIIKNAELRIEKVEIYDVLGQKYNSAFNILNSELTIDVSSLAPGIYFVAVRDEKNNVVVKKIVKM